MPGAVRRRAGGARMVAACLTVLLASGCGGIGQPAPYDSQGIDGLVIPTPTPDPDDFGASVDNPWLSLTAGSTWRYDVTHDGVAIGSIEAEVLDDTADVAGLDAMTVRTTTTIDGVAQRSTRFYAQDDGGNVWWLGEDAADVSWRAGEDGAEAGLAMPADPRLGDGWLSYVVNGLAGASVRVEQQGRDMVQTRDQLGSAAGSSTRRVYTSGVGLVTVEYLDSGWQADLVDHRAG